MHSADQPLQFGIRHLLAVMFVVSLAAALIAPWVRGWSAAQWLNLGTQTAVVAATIALYVGGTVWSRRLAMARLGTVHFRVVAKTWGQNAWRPSNAYVVLVFATLMLLLFTAATIASGGRRSAPFMEGIYAGLFAAMGVVQLRYPPDEMLIGEQGFALGGWRFIPWERASFACQKEHTAAPLFVKTTGWAFELSVSPEVVQPLAEFLRHRASPWHNPPQRTRKIEPPK